MIFNLSRFLRWLLAFTALFVFSLSGIAFFEVAAPNVSPNIVNSASFPNLDPRQIPNPLFIGGEADCNHKICQDDDDCVGCPNTSCQMLYTPNAALKAGYGVGTTPGSGGSPQGFCLQNSPDSPNGKLEYDSRVQNLVWAYTGLQQFDAIDSYPTFFRSNGRGDIPLSLACNAPSNVNSAPSVAGGGNRLEVNPLLRQSDLQYAFDEQPNLTTQRTKQMTLGMTFLDVRSQGIGLDPYAVIRDGSMRGEPVFKCFCGDGYLQVPGDPYNCHRDNCWPFWPLTTNDDVYSQTECNPMLGCKCNCTTKATATGTVDLSDKVLKYPKWNSTSTPPQFFQPDANRNHNFYATWPTRHVEVKLNSKNIDVQILKEEIQAELERSSEFWGQRRYSIHGIQTDENHDTVKIFITPELDDNTAFSERQVRLLFVTGKIFGQYTVTSLTDEGLVQTYNTKRTKLATTNQENYNYMIPEWDGTFYDSKFTNLCTSENSTNCITNYLLGSKCASGGNLCTVQSNPDAPTMLTQMGSILSKYPNNPNQMGYLGCDCIPNDGENNNSRPVSMLCSSKNVIRPRSPYSEKDLKLSKNAQGNYPKCNTITSKDNHKICTISGPQEFQTADPRFSLESLEWFVNKPREGYLAGMCTQDYHCGEESHCNKISGWCECLDPLNPIGSECYDPLYNKNMAKPCSVGDSGLYLNSPPFYMCKSCGNIEFPFEGFRIDGQSPPGTVDGGGDSSMCSVGVLDPGEYGLGDQYLSNYPQLSTPNRTLNLCNITEMGVELIHKTVQDAAGKTTNILVPKTTPDPDSLPSVSGRIMCSPDDASAHPECHREGYFGPPRCDWKLLPSKNEQKQVQLATDDNNQRFMIKVWDPNSPNKDRQFGCCDNSGSCGCTDMEYTPLCQVKPCHVNKKSCPLKFLDGKPNSNQEYLHNLMQTTFGGLTQTSGTSGVTKTRHLLDTDAIESSLPEDLRNYYCPWVLMPVCSNTECVFPEQPFRLCYRLCEAYNDGYSTGSGVVWETKGQGKNTKYFSKRRISKNVKGMSVEDPVLCFVTLKNNGTDVRFLNPPDERVVHQASNSSSYLHGCDPDLRNFVEFSTTANKCTLDTVIKGDFVLTSQQMVCKSSASVYNDPDLTQATCDFDNLSYLDSTPNSSDGYTVSCPLHCGNCHRRWEFNDQGIPHFCKNHEGDWGCCVQGDAVVSAKWCDYPFCGTYNDNDKDNFDPTSAKGQTYCKIPGN